MRVATLLLVLLLLALPARAQTPGQCTHGHAQARLDASDVAASLFNTGSLFFGNQTTNGDGYIVPRYSNRQSIYAANLWVGGRVNGQVRVASARYDRFNFWPGPLDPATGSPVNPADCSAYDRIYTVRLSDVAAYEQTGTATADLAAWPVGLGAAAVTAGGQPVVPTSLTQTINLAAGERPVVYGSQTAFWVMNDVGNVKAGSASPPIGIEVRVHAFSVASPEAALAQATFYRVELVHRGAAPFEDARVSLFTDPDLGFVADDYVGTDVSRSMAFVYNADNNDDRDSRGYGVAPPAIGFDLLDGAGASTYYISSGSGYSDPSLASAVYNHQQGLWDDGTPMRAFGNGYLQTQGAVTPFVFPGDPVTGQPWSEVNNGSATPTNFPGDRRMTVSSPPFTLQPGQARTFGLAVLFARGGSHLASITALRQVSDRIQALHDLGALYGPGLEGPPAVPPSTPALVAPADDVYFGITNVVRLDWAPAENATGYIVDVALDPDFSVGVVRTELDVDSLLFAPEPNVRQTYFWRVQAGNRGVSGPVSDVRRFTVYGPYRPRVEGIEEWDAAGPIATDADGAPTDPSLLTGPNSTRTRPPTYRLGAQGSNPLNVGDILVDGTLTLLDRLDFNNYLSASLPNEYEIRWVDPQQGQAVLNRSAPAPARYLTCWEIGTATSPTAGPSDTQIVQAPVVDGLPRMPFQYWQIAPDGTETQMHMNVLDQDGDNCYSFDTAANTGAAPLAGFGYERFYGSNVPYIQSELANVADVYTRSNVIQSAGTAGAQAFGRLSILPLVGPARPPQAGTRIRIVATDDYATSAEVLPVGTASLALDPARPNPVLSRATVRFTTVAAGAARLTLYDVLGRRVAVLAEGERAAGPHEAVLEASRLAPGVYLLVLESGGARAVRPVTVVR